MSKERKKRLEQLLEEIRPHVELWDYRNDEPLEENNDRQVALICINKQLELLRYLGSKDPKELYEDLVEQKRLLKYL